MKTKTIALLLSVAITLSIFAWAVYPVYADEYDDLVKKVNSGNLDEVFDGTGQNLPDQKDLEKEYEKYLNEDLTKEAQISETAAADEDIPGENEDKNSPTNQRSPVSGSTAKQTPIAKIGMPNVSDAINGTREIAEEIPRADEIANDSVEKAINETAEAVSTSSEGEADETPAPRRVISGNGGSCYRNFNSKETNWSNIEKHEVRELDVAKDYIMLYKFREMDFISEVEYLAKTNEGCVSTQIEILKSSSSEAETLSGAKYFNVWIGPNGYSGKSISDAYLTFSAPVGFADDENISLHYYADGIWKNLETEELFKNSGEKYYRASIPGSGNYAITGGDAGKEAGKASEDETSYSGLMQETIPKCLLANMTQDEWNRVKSNITQNLNPGNDEYNRSINYCDRAKFYWRLATTSNTSQIEDETGLGAIKNITLQDAIPDITADSSDKRTGKSKESLKLGPARQSYDGLYANMMYVPNLWINKSGGDLNYDEIIEYSGRIYIVWSDNRMTEAYSDNVLKSWGIESGEARAVQDEEFYDHAFTFPGTLGFKDGTLVKTDGSNSISMIKDNHRYDLSDKELSGFTGSSVLSVTNDEYNNLYDVQTGSQMDT